MTTKQDLLGDLPDTASSRSWSTAACAYAGIEAASARSAARRFLPDDAAEIDERSAH